jgi:hypothetical protein
LMISGLSFGGMAVGFPRFSPSRCNAGPILHLAQSLKATAVTLAT